MRVYFDQFWWYYLSESRVIIYSFKEAKEEEDEEEEGVIGRKAGFTVQTLAWYQSWGHRRRMLS